MSKEVIEAKQDPLAKWFNNDGSLKHPKHELLAQAYVQEFHWQKAVWIAGLAKQDDPGSKDVAYRIAKRPEVKRRVREIMKKRTDQIGINSDWVLMHLAEVVERAMAVHEIHDRDGNPTGVFEFDGRNANRALELIGNHLGMFKKDDGVVSDKVVINLDFGLEQEKHVKITRQPIEGEKA